MVCTVQHVFDTTSDHGSTQKLPQEFFILLPEMGGVQQISPHGILALGYFGTQNDDDNE